MSSSAPLLSMPTMTPAPSPANTTSAPSTTSFIPARDVLGTQRDCSDPKWYRDYAADNTYMSVCALPTNVTDPLPNNITTQCCNELGGKLWINYHDAEDDKNCKDLPPTVNCLTNDKNAFMNCLHEGKKGTLADMVSSTCVTVPPRSAATKAAPLGRAALAVLVVFALAVVSH